MKRRQRGLGARVWMMACAAAIAAGLSVTACGSEDEPPTAPGAGGAGGAGSGEAQKLVILHTNDLHSHLMGFGPEKDYTPLEPEDDDTRGGMARLAGAVAEARSRAASEGTPVLLLDAGDFMMGTLFELLGTTEAPELRFMQELGYDATTLGNHEFDWTPAGLAAILNAGREHGVSVPIVASNLEFSDADDGDDDLEALAQAGVIQSKLVKEVGGLKVGLFGLLGSGAAAVEPTTAPVTFEAISDAASRMVSELREDDGVDLVIALSHSGIYSDATGEDVNLANAVPGIDVIVSGHTHDFLRQPVRVGETVIVTAGAYGEYLGELELGVTPSDTAGEPAVVTVDGYTLHDLDDSVEGDADTQDEVSGYIDAVDAALSDSGLHYRDVVATTDSDLDLPEYAEAPVGDLVADAYRSVVASLQPDDPPVIAVEANGQLRAALPRGKSGEIWFSDLFRVLPLGIGPDQQPGLPLVTFYLNASDIASGLELGAAQEALSNDYFLQISGLKVEYDLNRPLFGRVASLALETEDGEVPLDPSDKDTCYKIVTTNYVAGLLGVVERSTSGLLAVTAKDSDCKTLVDPTTRFVDADPSQKGVQELKQWQALLGYVSGLPDTDDDDVPNIPAAYGGPQDRIVQQ